MKQFISLVVLCNCMLYAEAQVSAAIKRNPHVNSESELYTDSFMNLLKAWVMSEVLTEEILVPLYIIMINFMFGIQKRVRLQVVRCRYLVCNKC